MENKKYHKPDKRIGNYSLIKYRFLEIQAKRMSFFNQKIQKSLKKNVKKL